MRNTLFALSLFLCFGSFAQSVPNTTTFSLFDILDAVYGSHASGNLSDAFTASDAAKFDPTYGSKTMSPKTQYGFRNYGAACTRPSGLNTVDFYTRVAGVIINSEYLACIYSSSFSCVGGCTSMVGQATGIEGDYVYSGNGSDCTLLPDGYYIVACGTEIWCPIHILSGKLYYVYC